MSHPDTREAVQALFAGALERRAAADRQSFLDQACAGQPALRAEVESLLAAHDHARGFLATGDFPGQALRPPSSGCRRTGELIGAFRLIEQIGAGGMGAVYLAERADDAFDQRVAVKLVDAPTWSEEALRRFHAERQILASLRHPHIVALLDGGQTADGQAYLVMEYVDGTPITQHCERAALGVEARLRLFCHICNAVQHAHQHSVVHRDLKPANILVTQDGVPKVLDFGVAKLVGTSESDAEATATGLLRPMTPNYASPEQLRGLRATTVSDVYALGVLLYEVLAGVRPYEAAGKPLDEMLRLVIGQDVVPPSAAAPPGVRRRLRGDLDAIVLHAMRREPEQRYASARELADDVQRHLAGQPVVACGPALGYQVRRLIRLHRAAASAAAVSVLALAAALGVSLWQTRLARGQRSLAEQRFSDVRQLANALIFDIHDAVAPLQGSTPAREMIVAEALRYLERLNADAPSDPALRLELARGYAKVAAVQGLPSAPNLGNRQGALDNFGKAVRLLDEAVSRPGAPPALDLELARTNLQLSSTAGSVGDVALAREAIRAAEVGAARAMAREPEDEAARRLIGSVYFQQALLAAQPDKLEAWQRAAEVFDSLLADRPEDADRQRNVALVNKYIGGVYEGLGEYDRAAEHHRRAYELDNRRLEASPDDRQAQFDVAIDLSNLAYAAGRTGEWADAAQRYEQSLELRRGIADRDPSDVLARSRVAYALSRLGNAYSHVGRHAEAIGRGREALALLATLAAVGRGTDSDRAEFLLLFGGTLSRAGRPAEACDAWRQSAAVIAAAAGPASKRPSVPLGRIRQELEPYLAGCIDPALPAGR